MKTQISIIVPAYNIKNYLSDCLDSILAQDFMNYEIIIVDDGSTDGTAEICDDYQKHYDKISVIHQKNSGLSGARNAGIKQSKGEYLAFIDGDDLVASDFLSKLYQSIIKTSSEITICRFVEFSGTLPGTALTKATAHKEYSADEVVVRLLTQQENYDIVTWNKLYKKKLFDGIEFPIGKLHEDTLTTYKVLAAATKITCLEDELYYYRQRPGSIMAEQDLLNRLKIKEDAAKDAIKYFSNDSKLESAAEVALLLSNIAYLDNIASGKIHDKKLWRKTIEKINASRNLYKDNPYLTKKLKLYLGLLKTPIAYKAFRRIVHE